MNREDQARIFARDKRMETRRLGGRLQVTIYQLTRVEGDAVATLFRTQGWTVKQDKAAARLVATIKES